MKNHFPLKFSANMNGDRGCLFLQLMSELVLPAWLCLLMDWILRKDPGIAALNQQQMTWLMLSNPA